MALGALGEAGPSAPRTVEEDPRLEPGSVTLLSPPMVEIDVLGNHHSPQFAKPINVSIGH